MYTVHMVGAVFRPHNLTPKPRPHNLTPKPRPHNLYKPKITRYTQSKSTPVRTIACQPANPAVFKATPNFVGCSRCDLCYNTYMKLFKRKIKRKKKTSGQSVAITENTVNKKKFAFFAVSFKRVVVKLFFLAIILVALYIIIAPIWPQIRFYVWDRLGIDQNVKVTEVVEINLSKEGRSRGIHINKEKSGESEEIVGNYIEIPAIGVKMPIVEGDSDAALDGGHAWLRPNGVTPDQPGNTIITGHRFEYLSGGRTFYHLDKLKPGDRVLVHWGDKVYTYVVDNSFVVTPDHVEIEAPSVEKKLTLYTCTPLWTAKNRLVVIAHPE